MNRGGIGAHRAGEAEDLLARLALGAQTHQERPRLHVADLAVDDQLEHARGQIGVQVPARRQLVEHARHEGHGDRVQGLRPAHHEVVHEIDEFGMVDDGLLDLVPAILQEVFRGHAEYLRHGLDGVGLERPFAGDLLAQGLVFPAVDPAEELPQVHPRLGIALFLTQQIGQRFGKALLGVVKPLIGGIDHVVGRRYYIGVVITTGMLTPSRVGRRVSPRCDSWGKGGAAPDLDEREWIDAGPQDHQRDPGHPRHRQGAGGSGRQGRESSGHRRRGQAR